MTPFCASLEPQGGLKFDTVSTGTFFDLFYKDRKRISSRQSRNWGHRGYINFRHPRKKRILEEEGGSRLLIFRAGSNQNRIRRRSCQNKDPFQYHQTRHKSKVFMRFFLNKTINLIIWKNIRLNLSTPHFVIVKIRNIFCWINVFVTIVWFIK